MTDAEMQRYEGEEKIDKAQAKKQTCYSDLGSFHIVF